MGVSNPADWNFDLDKWLNPWIPPPPWQRLPYPISHFLGYRKFPLKPIGNLIIIAWAFIGIFLGIMLVELVTKQVYLFQEHQAPIIIASFGAASVLQFYSIESPLAQPRNAIFGQFISSVIGVGICKLFALSPQFESIRWLGGALATAIATALMAVTKTAHPPAGATALLAVVSDDALPLGWLLVPTMLLGAVVMLIVALFINNFQRRFPQYWWTPENLSSGQPNTIAADHTSKRAIHADLENASTLSAESRPRESFDEAHIIIRRDSVVIPNHLYLTLEEKAFLEELRDRL